jgi:ketosteroid isomerase-like protein
MPEQNVGLMRAAIEAFNRRDGAAFGALLANDADPHAGWVAVIRNGEITSFHTHADRAAALDAVGLAE